MVLSPFPLENDAKMPAATHAVTMSLYQGSCTVPPQELFTTSGARSGRGFAPFRSVGATIHCPAASSEDSLHELDSQPFALIHFAPGATPIRLVPSSPTIVPMVCVPWSTLSQGAAAGQTLPGSNQL